MKNILSILVFLVLGTNPQAFSQSNETATGLPGDHFSLEGALELFKTSTSPEDFEQQLNTESNHVNNLDLNSDDETDYVRVTDLGSDDAHVLILQAVVSADESQDIAVIEIEKTGGSEAVLQLIGDEDIFGEEVIVEPFDESTTDSKGPDPSYDATRIIVNVWLWPGVRSIYRPGYKFWVSPWRWRHYPRWYKPWRPHPVLHYLSLRPHHHRHFHRVHTHRVVSAHQIYVPRRTSSALVHKHYAPSLKNYRTNHGITQTKKTQVISGPNGGQAIVQKKTTRGTVQGARGSSVKTGKANVKVHGKNSDGDQISSRKTTKGVAVRKSNGNTIKTGKKSVKKNSAGVTKKSRTKTRRKSPRKN